MPSLRTETVLPLAPEALFPFFADAANLEKITPRSLRFQILTAQPIDMKEGTLIDYRIRISGIPQHWRTRIALWNPPHAFADEQIKGPYRRWFHTHRFEACPEGTMMVDQVDYTLPFGFMGKLAHPLIRRQLKKIFSYRSEALGNYLKIPDGKGIISGPIELSD